MSYTHVLNERLRYTFYLIGTQDIFLLKSYKCQSLAVVFVLYIIGAPQNHGLGPCENGPCAALFGPCVEDSDCLGGNVCVDDMDTCMNMIAPCCQKAPEVPEVPEEE